MKTSKLVNSYTFEKILDTLKYGVEFQKGFTDDNDGSYTLGTLEGTAHIVSCQIVQWFGLDNDNDFEGIGACDIMEYCQLQNFPDETKLRKSLAKLIKSLGVDIID